MALFDSPDSFRKLGLIGGGLMLAATGNPLGMIIPNLYAAQMENSQRRKQAQKTADFATNPDYAYDNGALTHKAFYPGGNVPSATQEQRASVINPMLAEQNPEAFQAAAMKNALSAPEAERELWNVVDTQTPGAKPLAVTPRGFADLQSRFPNRYAKAGDVSTAAEKSDPFKPVNMRIPETNKFAIANTAEELASLEKGGYAMAGTDIPGEKPADKPDFSRPDYWRTQIKPELQAANEARLAYDKIERAIKGGASLGTSIQLLQKMIDERGVVRGEDVQLYQQSMPLLEGFKQEFQTSKDGSLTADSKRKLLRLARDLTGARLDAFQSNYSTLVPAMQGEQVDPNKVVPADQLARLRLPEPTKPPIPAGAKDLGNGQIEVNGRIFEWRDE